MSLVLKDTASPGIGLLTLNRPDARNALSFELRQELIDGLAEFAEDETIRCVILTGGDQIFAAGADLRQLGETNSIDMIRIGAERYWLAIGAFPKPLIAAVNGFALGGRFRIGDARRHHHCRRERSFRVARGQGRADPRRGRHPASSPRNRQVRRNAFPSDRRYDER